MMSRKTFKFIYQWTKVFSEPNLKERHSFISLLYKIMVALWGLNSRS